MPRYTTCIYCGSPPNAGLGALAERDALAADNAALRVEIAQWRGERDALAAELADARAQLESKVLALVAERMRDARVQALEAIIDRAHFELSLEDVNPDDNRAAVLAILKSTQSSSAATSETTGVQK